MTMSYEYPNGYAFIVYAKNDKGLSIASPLSFVFTSGMIKGKDGERGTR